MQLGQPLGKTKYAPSFPSIFVVCLRSAYKRRWIADGPDRLGRKSVDSPEGGFFVAATNFINGFNESLIHGHFRTLIAWSFLFLFFC